MFGTGSAQKKFETHFTRWHESFIRDFLIGLCNAWTCVCVYIMPKRSGWLVGWLVGCWSDRASNLGSSFLVAAGLLYVHDCKSQEHNTVIYKC